VLRRAKRAKRAAVISDYYPVTCVVDGRTHAVHESEMVAGTGRYRARCRNVVWPGSMFSPPGPPCALCERFEPVIFVAWRPGR
jgi:hypothetical protein